MHYSCPCSSKPSLVIELVNFMTRVTGQLFLLGFILIINFSSQKKKNGDESHWKEASIKTVVYKSGEESRNLPLCLLWFLPSFFMWKTFCTQVDTWIRRSRYRSLCADGFPHFARCCMSRHNAVAVLLGRRCFMGKFLLWESTYTSLGNSSVGCARLVAKPPTIVECEA